MSSSCVFDYPDADVILRAPLQPGSGEFKDFHVHKLILSIASTVFRDTFSIPQPPPRTSKGTSLDVVQTTEPADVVEIFLQLIYPIDPPVITDLQLLDDLLQLADKYVAGGVTTKLKKFLVSPAFLKDDPIGVFAIASRRNFGEEERLAIPHTFRIDLVQDIIPTQLRMMTLETYHSLLMEHSLRRQQIIEIVDAVSSDRRYMFCSHAEKLKKEIRLKISGSPFLDREKLERCFPELLQSKACVDPHWSCLISPLETLAFLTEVMCRVQATPAECVPVEKTN